MRSRHVPQEFPPTWPDWAPLVMVADRWRLNLETILRYVRRGELQARRGARGWEVHRAVIEAAEEARRIAHNEKMRKYLSARYANDPGFRERDAKGIY